MNHQTIFLAEKMDLEDDCQIVLLVLAILGFYFELRECIPVLPHKAVAEVSKIGDHRKSTDGGVVPFGMVAVVASPTTAGCSVVWCSCSCRVVVVVV